MNINTVTVIGLGYIGLPTAAMFAETGFNVVGIDINSKIVSNINLGKIHIEEIGLQEIVEKNVINGRLTASTNVGESDVFLIAVPTPLKAAEKKKIQEPDISHVEEAIRNITPFLKIV